MCNQIVKSEILGNNFTRVSLAFDQTQVKLFPNFTSIPLDYLLISWVTNYVSNLGFLTCLSRIVSIKVKNSILANVQSLNLALVHVS